MKRVANSFNQNEVEILDFILTSLLRKSDPSMVTRKPEYATLVRKVGQMKRKIMEVPSDT